MASAGRSSITSCLRTPSHLPPTFLLPFTIQQQQHRHASQSANAQKYKRKDQPTSARKKKTKSSYDTPDLKNAIQFPLLDAMR